MSLNYYTAKVFVRQCLVDIRINDVPLLRRNIEGDTTVELPINYLIESSGYQNLTIQVFPMLGSVSLLMGAVCSVEIWRYDGSGKTLIPLEQICSSKIQVDSKNQTIPIKGDRKLFIADVSYHISRWSDCAVLKDSRSISSAVASYFQTIGHILANKQFDNYIEHIRNRELNIRTALSLDEKDVNDRNRILFEYLSNGFTLCPMKGGKLIEFYANRRIVTILDHDMRSALRFKNEQTGEMLAIELFLGIKQGQKDFCIV